MERGQTVSYTQILDYAEGQLSLTPHYSKVSYICVIDVRYGTYYLWIVRLKLICKGLYSIAFKTNKCYINEA